MKTLIDPKFADDLPVVRGRAATRPYRNQSSPISDMHPRFSENFVR